MCILGSFPKAGYVQTTSDVCMSQVMSTQAALEVFRTTYSQASLGLNGTAC